MQKSEEPYLLAGVCSKHSTLLRAACDQKESVECARNLDTKLCPNPTPEAANPSPNPKLNP